MFNYQTDLKQKSFAIFKNVIGGKIKNSYYPCIELNEFERDLLTDNIDIERVKKKVSFGINIDIEEEFYRFTTEYIGVLSKLAVHTSRHDFGRLLHRIFLNGNKRLKSRYPETAKIFIRFKYPDVTHPYDYNDVEEKNAHEYGLIYTRRLWKLMRTIHRKRGRFFRKFVKDELVSMFGENYESMPEQFAQVEFFRNFIGE